ncbi:MAG TPA: S9 family peptidase [Polyangiaceae bacterium]|nr:MAG: Prolyl tripeptidyl peptidase precursor [Deltaproteobacteria bacterium ADurb.Bin207]HNS97411.1 S9 family peptidase [Polyangiaceae bacterium]HNZ24007.1 S9 family peptidase [Polyangiaceae bacterium]HOD21741.1 S9 family peptidase [Polyangiaceae bacterium]HOE51089.1 S9 family peptidase [Polyangiaceae bacterium]
MRSIRLAFILPLLPLFCSSEPTIIQAAEKKPFNVRDLVQLERASSPVLSPDGRSVVFVLRTTDMEANKGRTDLWMMSTDGKNMRRLTTHEANDWNPRWMGPKTIGFLSTRSGSSQIHALEIDGGEARQLTSLPIDIETFQSTPDGSLIVFSAAVYPECKTIECTVEKDKKIKESKATGRVYDKLFFRHWDTWKDGKRNHLFALRTTGGEPVDLMKGLDADCPLLPFGGIEDYTIAPDGQNVAFSMKKPMGSQEAWSTNDDIWLVPTDGSASPKNISEANEARDSMPVYSPDGKSLAYLAMKQPGYEADRYRVVLYDLASGSQKVLTEAWDRSPDSLTFGAKGARLWVTADHFGQHSIFSIDVRSGKEKLVIKDGSNSSPMETDRGVLYLRNDLRSPADFFVASASGGNERRLSTINQKRLESVGFGDAEPFSFQGAKGDTVYGYVVKPVGFEANQKYPIAFLIHGGPQGSFGNSFHYRWNPQTYAGAGYASVMIDFHGSTGYGQAFTDAIRGDWGGAPFEDLMKGLDAAVAKYPWLDGQRACALGASYGGYMINWIAGHTDRFKCLVAHDGNLDERMAYFDTEELWFPEWEHQGTPWENPEGYAKHNPIDHVKNWKTPMMVVHGSLDYRVVDTQGFSVFTVLQRKGIPSKLLHFPDENHWVLKPHNSILWHDEVLGWLDRWLK